MTQVHETELDLGALAGALWRRAWLLALVSILAGAATYAILSSVQPQYRADARLLIEARESPLTRPREDVGQLSVVQFDESAILSQVEVLRSREIAAAVIEKLDLAARLVSPPRDETSLLDVLAPLLGRTAKEKAVGAPRRKAGPQGVLETYYEHLAVYPIARSRVIAIEFTAADPQLAADVANAIADAFVAVQQNAKRETTTAATEWLEQEIERLRTRVAEAESKVETYRAGSGLFGVSQTATSLSGQQLTDLNAELGRARAQLSEARARADQMRAALEGAGSLDTSQEVLASPLIQRLRERQVALRSQIADLSTSLLPGHPRIRALTTQLAEIDAQIVREARKVLQSLETTAQVAKAREEALMRDFNGAKAAVAQSNEQEIELRALEREAAAQRELLETFLARYREAAARVDADYLPADVRIISRAVPPSEPYYPKTKLLSAAGAVGALLLASVIVLLRTFTSGRAFRIVGTPDLPVASPARWIEPPLDAIPAVGMAPSAVALAEEPAGAANVAEALAQEGVRVALFSGAGADHDPGEIALSAARMAAAEGSRIILLDIGVQPSKALGREDAKGLGELLSGHAAFGEVIARDESSRVHVIPLGRRDGNPPLQRLSLAVGALSHTYDKVVVVAHRLEDWPAQHVRPDLAAIVCGHDVPEEQRRALHDATLVQGARAALVIRREAPSVATLDDEAA